MIKLRSNFIHKIIKRIFGFYMFLYVETISDSENKENKIFHFMFLLFFNLH